MRGAVRSAAPRVDIRHPRGGFELTYADQKHVQSYPSSLWKEMLLRLPSSVSVHRSLSQRLAFAPLPVRLDGRLLNNPEPLLLPQVHLPPTPIDPLYKRMNENRQFRYLAQAIVLDEAGALTTFCPRVLAPSITLVNEDGALHSHVGDGNHRVGLVHWHIKRLKLGSVTEVRDLEWGHYTLRKEEGKAPEEGALWLSGAPLGFPCSENTTHYLCNMERYVTPGLDRSFQGSKDFAYNAGTDTLYPALLTWTPLLRASLLLTLSPAFEEEALLYEVREGVVEGPRKARLGCPGLVALSQGQSDAELREYYAGVVERLRPYFRRGDFNPFSDALIAKLREVYGA